MEPAPRERDQSGFNWSYNLNKDLFWSSRPSKVSSPSVPGTPGPTVALAPALYRERRGLGALGKQRSGQLRLY